MYTNYHSFAVEVLLGLGLCHSPLFTVNSIPVIRVVTFRFFRLVTPGHANVLVLVVIYALDLQETKTEDDGR